MKISGKTIWITGASSGIGMALAREFSSDAGRLILSARRTEILQELASELQEYCPIDVIPLDLADTARHADVVAKVGQISPVDILIHNAGISQRSLASETTLEVDRRIFEVNYFGTISITKQILPDLIARRSQIVVITSLVGKIASKYRSSYAASKHALHGFFDSVRCEHDDTLTVTLIMPGFVHTEMSINALNAQGDKHGIMDDRTARGLRPEAFAQKARKAIQSDELEIAIGGSETSAIILRRLLPKRVFHHLLTRAKVK